MSLPAARSSCTIYVGYGTYASAAYLARHGTPASPQELRSEHTCVGHFSASTERLSPMVFQLGDERIEVSECAYSTNDGETQLLMIREGFGVGQFTARLLEDYLRSGELVEILQTWWRPALPFNIVFPPGKRRCARLSVFVEWLTEGSGLRRVGMKSDRPKYISSQGP
nr:LysR substrate-binding domain-containing protein [Ensifer aridi]